MMLEMTKRVLEYVALRTNCNCIIKKKTFCDHGIFLVLEYILLKFLMFQSLKLYCRFQIEVSCSNYFTTLGKRIYNYQMTSL
jgi:hypothetical protein